MFYLPDPWDPDEFPILKQHDARMILGISSSVKVLLVFGDLSIRKGLDLIIEAINLVKYGNFVVVMAGKISTDFKASAHWEKLLVLVGRGQVILRDEYIGEDYVSAYFCASDAVVSAYPRSFTVSSGNFTRACASARPIVVSAHGVIGRMVNLYSLGITFKTGSAKALSFALDEVLSGEALRYSKINAEAISSACALECYGRRLLAAYKCVMRDSIAMQESVI